MRNIHLNRHKLLVTVVILAILVAVFLFIQAPLMSMIMPFIIAVILAYLVAPLVKFVERRGVPRMLSIILIVALILGIIVLVVMNFVPNLLQSFTAIINNLPQMANAINKYTNDLANWIQSNNLGSIQDYIDINGIVNEAGKTASNLLKGISDFVINNSGSLMNIVIVPLVMIMLLSDREMFSEALYYFVPTNTQTRVHKMFNDINEVIGGFIRGQSLMSLVAGIATGVSAAIIGLPYASVIGVIAGVTTLVPYFGPVVGFVLIGAIAIFSSLQQFIIIMIAMAIIQLVAGNVIGPALMSAGVGLHPILIIFSIFFFGAWFGGLGMILAVPIMGAIRVILIYLINGIGGSIAEAPDPTESEKQEPEKKELPAT
ncbi:MAG: AI-2E family transporter [Eubacteriaceae bacterium]|nr:AI-2E family transporter [Eubacteriaceae bacterium]